MIKNMISLCLLLLLATKTLSAQQAGDYQLLMRAFEPEKKQKLSKKYTDSQNNPNEVQALLSGLFLLYKNFVSSQDDSRCNFHPSCSEYGLQAVKQFGVIRGGISTFDRMTRCNGLENKKYQPDFKTGRLLDPVSW